LTGPVALRAFFQARTATLNAANEKPMYVVHIPLTLGQADLILEMLRNLEADMQENGVGDNASLSMVRGARTRIQDALNAR